MAKPKDSAASAAAASDDKPLKHLWLVDGSGYLFRAYHALPPMTRPDGTPINAVYGFCRMLALHLDEARRRPGSGHRWEEHL